MEKVLTNSFENYLKNLKVLDENIFHLREQMEFLRLGVISKKESNPELKSEDVKDDLIRIQELNYEMTLKYQEGVNMANIIVELFTIIKASGMEYDPGEDKDFVESLSKGSRRMFVISEKDRTVGVVDIAEYNEQMQVVKASAADPEKLDAMFNSPAFSSPKK